MTTAFGNTETANPSGDSPLALSYVVGTHTSCSLEVWRCGYTSYNKQEQCQWVGSEVDLVSHWTFEHSERTLYRNPSISNHCVRCGCGVLPSDHAHSQCPECGPQLTDGGWDRQLHRDSLFEEYSHSAMSRNLLMGGYAIVSTAETVSTEATEVSDPDVTVICRSTQVGEALR